jgi:hypothetical protein
VVKGAALVSVLLVASSCTTSDNIEIVRTDWMLEAPPNGKALPVLVQIGGSSCNSFREVRVTETSSEVAIEAFVNHKTNLRLCSADLRMQREPVQLAAPLGDRSLVGCWVSEDEAKALGIETDCTKRVVPVPPRSAAGA